MTSETTVLLPEAEETLDLVEQHRQLIALYGLTVAQEQDTYSLAQPSPFRFVPAITSNGTAPLAQGE